jgi:hypothetical protein
MATHDQPRDDGWTVVLRRKARQCGVWRAHRQPLLTRLTASRAWRGGWRTRPGSGAAAGRSQGPGQMETAVAGWFARFPAGVEPREDTHLADP